MDRHLRPTNVIKSTLRSQLKNGRKEVSTSEISQVLGRVLGLDNQMLGLRLEGQVLGLAVSVLGLVLGYEG